MLSYSTCAAASLSEGRRRAGAWKGGPFVGIKCSTLCLTDDGVKIGVVMVGNSASNASY